MTNVKELKTTSKKEATDLKKELAASKKEVKELSKQLEKVASIKSENLSKSIKKLLEALFPRMEFDYEIRDPTIKFYSDPSCKEVFQINKELIWIGWTDYDYPYYDESTDTTYTYFVSAVVDDDSKEGFSLVYSKKQPILYAIK